MTFQTHLDVTRIEASVFPIGDVNRRYFTAYIEQTPQGWAVHDGHDGYDADGAPHPGEPLRHPLEDYDAALLLAVKLAPTLTVNGRMAAEVAAA
ncbi:hypothetical protein ABZ863_35000 [Saccharomonospora sp. NPDC046836]|uniref:hypothetical protein n=1 Tax=Saccharomonospora sp. NPDC046836 TaxID=3156921 RepID=UPI0033C1F01B